MTPIQVNSSRANNVMLKPSIFSQSQAELNLFLRLNNVSTQLSSIFFQQIYKNKFNQELGSSLALLLKNSFDFSLPVINKITTSEDGTIKFLMGLEDGNQVETVLIPFFKKYTVCISSQVGCAMNCSFCYTGKMGLKRNLKSSEIVGQFLVARQYLQSQSDERVKNPNIVFMGQGEPLHNSEEVLKSILVLMEPMGAAVGPRQITLSTAGYLPGIKKLSHYPQINIALSLHSPFNDIRKKLIPINQHFPLEDIFLEFDKLELKKKQFITYEYLLIKDLNNRLEDALELAKWLSNRRALINIIPFNPFPGSEFQRPTDEDTQEFKEKLVALKLRTMIRTTKGSEILAACGQLNSLIE